MNQQVGIDRLKLDPFSWKNLIRSVRSIPLPHNYRFDVSAILLINIAVLAGAILLGPRKGMADFYFREREIVTFLSALQLALSSVVAMVIFNLYRQAGLRKQGIFWMLCSVGFFWLMLDEWFLIHEGIDDGILGAFGLEPEGRHFLLDWIVIAGYGAGAAVVSYLYLPQVLYSRKRILFFGLAGLLFVGTTFADALHPAANFRLHTVIEESMKLLSVCFFYLFFMTALFETIKGLVPEGKAVPQEDVDETPNG